MGNAARLVPFAEPSVRLEVTACARFADASLTLHYHLHGELGACLVPGTAAAAHRRDGLWQHTCLECFFALPGELGYWELNVSPSGEWNVYAFDDYRKGQRPADMARAPNMSVNRRGGTLTAGVDVDLSALRPPAAELVVYLCAVIELQHGDHVYFALHHPRSVPDFHHRDGFLARIALQGGSPHDPANRT